MAVQSYDVIVVGAGAIGLSVSYVLAKKNVKTAVVAPADDTQGATRAAGAMIDAFGEIEFLHSERDTAKLDFEVQCQRKFPNWLSEIEEVSGQPVFNQNGFVIVSNSGGEHDKAKLKLMREQMTEYGESFDELDPKDVVGLVPNYIYRAHEALYIPSAQAVDAAQLLSALEAAISTSDCVDRKDLRVTKIEQEGASWTVRTESGTTLTAAKIVVCAGAHSLRLIPDDRLAIPKLYFGRGSSVTVVDGPELPYTIRTPNRALSCGIHMVPRANGRLYLGATNLFGMDYENLPKGPTVGELHTLFEAIQNELNTNLRNVSIESMHSGLRPVSQFDTPLCGKTNLDGLFIATATHRTGVHMSPLVAEMVVGDVLDEEYAFDNPFMPTAEHQTNKAVNLRLGVRSLIATILFPTGRLPYNRMEEIETYITELLTLAVQPDKANGLSKELQDIIGDVPLDEQSVLQTYHHILEAKLPEYGPYPS